MHPPETTIAALSTPPGRGGIAILRLSGPDALRIATRVFHGRLNTRIQPGRATLGRFRSPAGGEELDTGYLTLHPAGRSYTGQESVELSCHASPAIVERLLSALLESGATAADPGEFTYRAVLNGRLDLAQAEAVRDLINAPTASSARLAYAQLRGGLSREIGAVRELLVDVVCRAEAGLEFAEEQEIFPSRGELARRIDEVAASIDRFLSSYRRGRLLSRGAMVVLAGRPNSGKSSLFNALLRLDRAIVSDQPGTTRDFLSEMIDLEGMPVTLVDTAGLRPDAGGLEAEGIKRTRRQMEVADLILVLCPCDETPDDEDHALVQQAAGRAVLVASKSDLPRRPWTSEAHAVSAMTGAGIENLHAVIAGALGATASLSVEEVLVTDARHNDALQRCRARLAAAQEGIAAGAPEEVVLVDLHAALEHLGEITGKVSLEEMYDRIFSTFCIGK